MNRITEMGNIFNVKTPRIKDGKKSEAVNKLYAIEDIMEKYGIDGVEELDELLADGKDALNKMLNLHKNKCVDAIKEWFNLDEDFSFDYGKTATEITTEHEYKVKEIYGEYINDLQHDRNTWKKACEMACDDLELWPDNTKEELITYFYTQAQKERKDE